jgi:hypothetical protein
MSANDKQIAGTHYDQPIQVWDFVSKNRLGYLEGNIIKYVARHPEKNGVEDLKKARHYLDKLIEVEEEAVKPIVWPTAKVLFDQDEQAQIDEVCYARGNDDA